MNTTISWFVAVAVATSCLGCGDDDAKPQSTPKSTVEAFQTGTVPDGAAISLKEVSLDESGLDLAVVAHNIDAMYGVAFRLSYDPKVFELTSFEVAPPLNARGATTAQSRESQPGLGVFVATLQGANGGLNAGKDTVATLRLERKDATLTEEATVAFVGVRSDVIRADGSRVEDVAWIGGTLLEVVE